MPQSPAIEVVSDVVCPWCFVGKRRLEKALALLGRSDAMVRWTAFELNPEAPKEGMDRQAYRLRKFGSAEYSRQLEARVAAAGAEEGIEFQFDRIERIPNTFDAHRLIWLAAGHGVQDAVVEALFRAYFTEAIDIGQAGALRRIGLESGIPEARVEELLTGDLGRAEVLAEKSRAREFGVNAVPAFRAADEPIASGALKAVTLAKVLGPVLAGYAEQCSIEAGNC